MYFKKLKVSVYEQCWMICKKATQQLPIAH